MAAVERFPSLLAGFLASLLHAGAACSAQVWEARLDSEAQEASFGTPLIDAAAGLAWFPYQVDGQQGGIGRIQATGNDSEQTGHLHPPGFEQPLLLAAQGGELLVSSFSIDAGIQLPLQPPLTRAWLSAYDRTGALRWRRGLGSTFSYQLHVGLPVHAGRETWRFWRGTATNGTVQTLTLVDIERDSGAARIPAQSLRFSYDGQAERVAAAFSADGSPMWLRLSRQLTNAVLLQQADAAATAFSDVVIPLNWPGGQPHTGTSVRWLGDGVALLTGSLGPASAQCLLDARQRRLLQPCSGIANPVVATSSGHVAVVEGGTLAVYNRVSGQWTWQIPLSTAIRPVAILDEGAAVIGVQDDGAATAVVRLDAQGERARLALGFSPQWALQVAVDEGVLRAAAVPAASRTQVLLSTTADLGQPWQRQQTSELPGVTELRTRGQGDAMAAAGVQRLADGSRRLVVSQHAVSDGTPRWRQAFSLAGSIEVVRDDVRLATVDEPPLLLAGLVLRGGVGDSPVQSLLLALDPDTGSVRWTLSDTGGALDRGSVLHGVDADGRVVLGSPERLQVFAPDGSLVWQRAPGLGVAALTGHHLLAASAETLLNLDSRNGNTRWSTSASGVRRVLAGGGAVILAGTQIRALDLDSGAERWQRALGGSMNDWPGYLLGGLDPVSRTVVLEPGNFAERLLQLDLENGVERWAGNLVHQSATQSLAGITDNQLVRALDGEGLGINQRLIPGPPQWQRYAAGDGRFLGMHANRQVLSRWSNPKAAFDVSASHVALGGRNVAPDEQPPSGRAQVVPTATLHQGLLVVGATSPLQQGGPVQLRVNIEERGLDRPLPFELVLPEFLSTALELESYQIDGVPAPLPIRSRTHTLPVVLQPGERQQLQFSVRSSLPHLDGVSLALSVLTPPEFALAFGSRSDGIVAYLQQPLFTDGLED